MATRHTPSAPREAWPARLTGAWSLHGIRELDADGALLGEPYEPEPAGRLHYGPGSQTAVVIRGRGQAPAVAYIGDFETGPDGLVRHLVRVGLPPFTEDQTRWARLEGDRLTLTNAREGRSRIELLWARA
jgi:hypothetical protein